MAERTCRSCGGVVAAGATACPHCGVPDPVTDPVMATPGPAAPPTPDPRPDPAPVEAATGSRMTNALKAIGCLAIAMIVLLIAIMVGLFDVFF